MSKPFGSGSVTVQPSRGLWQASYLGQKVTYSEARFGPMAETLAHRALLKLQAGNFDPVSDDLQFKQSWRMVDAARQLGLSLGQLRQWMLTGMLNGHVIKPPMRDVKGVDRITGCELMMAQERLAECKSGLSLCNG
ncbi:hypothetical protein JD499_11630 [Aeromonas enteropelogenes]|uniref:Uncharacterized protein n=2 Tax=Aeromonadaceae TaxID=84642 RepID=A0A3S5WR97_AERCA|nr:MULTISPECIES: hypothetical protein [Aeromonas]AXB03948.1 hypothetical protein C1C91_01835 [Aeromonas caviae]AXB07848.1 hypothetical protein C0708_02400 [Aeromonas caviae]MBL0457852.1 hypothetical protein [Aeromonas enteropelogenes]MCE9850314.1 hypothetical protein [Aeromonas allosaccharophila]MCF5885177.1 hypothetical protein [Aeromonas veronii]